MDADQRGGSTPNGKPSRTVEEAATGLLRDGLAWTAGGAPLEITYAFRATAPGTMPPETSGFSQLSYQQMWAVEAALRTWEAVANIEFVRVSDAGSDYSNAATMLFANYDSGGQDFAAFAYLPGDRAASSFAGDIWIDSSDVYNQYVTEGDYGFLTLIHEIGHALGLQHPSDYNGGNVTYASAADYYEDSLQFSVMSYFDITETGGRAGYNNSVPRTPMIDDIAAIQRLYGARADAFAGDTFYGSHYTIPEGAERGPDALIGSHPDVGFWATIWDAGGTDVIDLSYAEDDQRINLNPGSFSDVVGDVGTLSIAMGTTIENAVGGSMSDTIIGNNVANRLDGRAGDDRLAGGDGGDTLIGGRGDDVLTGGRGPDIFLFQQQGSDSDRITDFNLSNDRIDLFGERFTSVANAGSTLRATHDGGVVTFDGLAGTSVDALNARLVPVRPLIEPIPPSFYLSGPDGFVAGVAGSGMIFGTGGGQHIRLLDPVGYVTFDGSFNQGGDMIVLDRRSDEFTVRRSGSSVEITDGATTMIVPIGFGVTTIAFSDKYLGLVIDAETGDVMLGTQTVFTAPFQITAESLGFDFPQIDPLAAGQLRLVEDADVTIKGRVTVFGTHGDESVTLLAGSNALFDGSFNAGGDRIVLTGAMAAFDVARSGSSAVFASDRGWVSEVVTVPAGPAGTVIVFDDGEHVLRIDPVSRQILLGEQVLGTTAAEVSGAPLATVDDVVPPMMAMAAFDAVPGDFATFAL